MEETIKEKEEEDLLIDGVEEEVIDFQKKEETIEKVHLETEKAHLGTEEVIADLLDPIETIEKVHLETEEVIADLLDPIETIEKAHLETEKAHLETEEVIADPHQDLKKEMIETTEVLENLRPSSRFKKRDDRNDRGGRDELIWGQKK